MKRFLRCVRLFSFAHLKGSLFFISYLAFIVGGTFVNFANILSSIVSAFILFPQVVLFDRHFDGPFRDLIQTAFSPNKPLQRIEDYKGQLVLFERLGELHVKEKNMN